MDDVQTNGKTGAAADSQPKPTEKNNPTGGGSQSVKKSPAGKPERDTKAAHKHHRQAPASPDEVVLAAAAIAITLCNNKTVAEIQTLLNLFSTTNDLIDSILKQRLINKPFEPPILSIDLD